MLRENRTSWARWGHNESISKMDVETPGRRVCTAISMAASLRRMVRAIGSGPWPAGCSETDVSCCNVAGQQ